MIKQVLLQGSESELWNLSDHLLDSLDPELAQFGLQLRNRLMRPTKGQGILRGLLDLRKEAPIYDY